MIVFKMNQNRNFALSVEEWNLSTVIESYTGLIEYGPEETDANH